MRGAPDPVPQPPAAVLRRVAAELAQCQSMLHGIEDVLAPLLAVHPLPGDGHTLQDIDLLCQTLTDLATCIDALAQTLPGAPAVDAHRLLAPLRLADLARRLGGQSAATLHADARVALF